MSYTKLHILPNLEMTYPTHSSPTTMHHSLPSLFHRKLNHFSGLGTSNMQYGGEWKRTHQGSGRCHQSWRPLAPLLSYKSPCTPLLLFTPPLQCSAF